MNTQMKECDPQWLSEQVHQYGISEPHIYAPGDGSEYFGFVCNGRHFTIEIHEAYEIVTVKP